MFAFIIILANPGPGSYRIPSEFGYYESKYAKTLDAEQWKKQNKNPSKMAKTTAN